MKKLSSVFVISMEASRFNDLIPAAAALGENVYAVWPGPAAEVSPVFALGATALYTFAPRPEGIFEEYALSIADLIKKSGGGQSLVLLPANKRGKAMAAKLGAALSACVINEASSIETGKGVIVRHRLYGGLAVGEERSLTDITIVTVPPGIFESRTGDAGVTGVCQELAFIPPKQTITRLQIKPRQTSSVNIAKAKRVVAAGRGFTQKEDLRLAEELASALEAELGCTRPIAEGEHWMERERYIGVSGVTIKSSLYMALGVSGQVQHMVGAGEAGCIVAVNKDKNAPIFSYADYGIVGDLYKVVPALIRAFRK